MSFKLKRVEILKNLNPTLVNLFTHSVFLIELINTAASLSSFLLAGVERMAFGTDLYVDVFVGRTCYKRVAAVTSYRCLIILWMDSLFHDFTSSLLCFA